MALITESPVLIDPIVFSRAPDDPMTTGANWGVFVFGAAAYMLLVGQNDAIPPYTQNEVMAMFKSTDGGVSWAVVGTAPTNNGHNRNTCFYDEATGIISALFVNSNTAAVIAEFDCNTDTWSGISAVLQILNPGPSQGSPFTSDGLWFCKNGADYWAFFSNQVRSTNKGLYYKKLTGGIGGTWGAETLVVLIGPQSPIAADLMAGVLDSATGNMHLIYRTGSGGSTFHRIVSSAGAVGAADDLGVLLPSGGQTTIARIWNGDTIVFGYPDTVANSMNAAVGTPLAAPVWTISVIGGPYSPANLIPVDTTGFLDKDGNPVIAWDVVNIFSAQIDSPIYMSRNSGSGWGLTQVYDEPTNPPAITDYTLTRGVHTLSGTQLSDGNWIFGTAFDFSNGDFSINPCAGFALITASIAIPATIDLDLDLGISFSFGFSGGPPGPNPPEFCELVPPGTSPSLVAYDEPHERDGS